MIHRAADAGAVRYAIADKHLSNTHYFRSRVEFLWLLQASGASRTGFYCVRLSRARIDPPRWFRGIVMRRIKTNTKRALESSLGRTRQRLQALAGSAALF